MTCSNDEVLDRHERVHRVINGSEVNVRRRFQRAVARKSIILLPSIVAFELWYGAAKSQRKEFARVPRLKWEDWAVTRRLSRKRVLVGGRAVHRRHGLIEQAQIHE